MRDWSLGPGDPLYMTLAADSRLCKPDYVNDHIWELELGTADPPSISLYTTFGLRARSMRLFLRFTENHSTITDPSTFISKPTLRRFYPNFLTLDFSPLENLVASAEFWVPASQTLAGRLAVTNRSNATRQLKIEVCAVLSPLDGQSIIPTQQQLVNILAGQTGGIAPVIFMTGGPKHGPGPYPSLLLDLELGPGSMRQLSFAEAALDTVAASFELARHSAARPWDAERARIELLDASEILDIRTGDTDWDATLAFSQRAAKTLFFNASDQLPNSSFVQARRPDHGFSRKGDGSDHSPAWSGQTPLESYYVSSILHGTPQVARDLLFNFLAAQSEDGEIDHRPGLAGQRARLLAAPILAALAWNYYEISGDQEFLAQVFPNLLRFFWAWSSSAHDRNRDGIPEWDHILQTGFDDNPIFDVWNPWSQGLDISLVHSPALEAMLYREAQSLVKMARVLGKPAEETTLVESQAQKLKESIEADWNARTSFYTYRDRETGLSSTGKVIAKKKGDGDMRPKFESESQVRLLIEIQTKNPAAKRPEVEISEQAAKTDGDAETIQANQFQWRSGGLVATTKQVYARVGRVSVRGLEEKDRIQVKVIDTSMEDLTLALPVWAAAADKQKVNALLGRNLLSADRFDRPFGWPSLADAISPQAETVSMGVHFPWNQFVAEGLLSYGYRAEVTRLTAHMMNAAIQNLKQNRGFYQCYHAERGSGIGERNSLHGFAPLGLFMQALGVTILSAVKVRLQGKNLFPWPVTIKYKGLTIVRGLDQTVVTFANGESIMVKDEQPCIVEI